MRFKKIWIKNLDTVKQIEYLLKKGKLNQFKTL